MITTHNLKTGIAVIVDDATDLVAFKELIQRGANLWPDAPPAIKSLADMVTNGKEMQPYFQMGPTNKV